MADFPRNDFSTLVRCKDCGAEFYVEMDCLDEAGKNAVHSCETDDEPDQFMSDAEADADALASCGWGTDEDYGAY